MRKAVNPSVSAIAAIAERLSASVGNNQTGQQLLAEVNRVRMGAEALDNANANRSLLDTDAAHALSMAKRARQLGTEVTASFNRALKTWADGYQEIQRRIEEKVNLKPHVDAVEIRSVFRSLDSKAKALELQNMVEQNRGPELAALLKGSPLTTGLTDEQRAAYEKAFIAKHAAAELDEQSRLEEMHQAATTANNAAADLVKHFTDPAKLADIERNVTAANAAGDAFDQSLK